MIGGTGVITKLKELARTNPRVIGIGVSLSNREYISRTILAAESAAKQGYAKVVLVGDAQEIETFGISSNLQIHHTHQPEQTLIDLLLDGEIEGVVRGSASASKFLQALKARFNLSKIFRIALLETSDRFTFLFAPIGIDEGTSIAEKVTLTRAGIILCQFLGLEPIPVAILSGGRISDIGRNSRVDRSLAEAEEVVSILKTKQISSNVKHYEILIEEAIAAQCKIIIAPDGIAGNLIYRTLVHLGAGKSHGAWYYNLPKPIIDTSRVGPKFEYESALAFASALVSKHQ
ncbi:MAG: methanogenesis marker protein Mmp4/MtxX [Candidatus Helarchaeota archaeon]